MKLNLQPGQEVVWKPTTKQAEFLSASEEEVLYGGAAGGGKSDALLIDALGLHQHAVLNPIYRGILFRRSFGELGDLIDRSKLIYPLVIPGAIYSATEHEWRFPSGSKVIFGYLEQDEDRYRYHGRQYQWIGWDELTLWPTPVPYEFLLSRLRSPDPDLKCFVRAATNPGGPGHQWVRNRWQIPDDGSPMTTSVDIEGRAMVRRFIPARLVDNPYLAESGYREQLLSLDETSRKALLEGRWDVIEVPGAYFREELIAAYAEGRITSVPYDPALPVDTYWDLGVGDATAIWFVQRGPFEARVIDYIEDEGEGIQYYAKVLADRGYIYGEHWAPFDIQVRELGTGKSRYEMAQNLGIQFQVVPKLDFEDGINAVRAIFSRLWFDKKKCSGGLDALANYRKDIHSRTGQFKPRPVHDWSSHAADALRYFAIAYRDAAPLKSKRDRPHRWNYRTWMSV
jgi:hypothetical protein